MNLEDKVWDSVIGTVQASPGGSSSWGGNPDRDQSSRVALLPVVLAVAVYLV